MRISWLFVLLCALEHAFTAWQDIFLGRDLAEMSDLEGGKSALASFGGPSLALLLSLAFAWIASIWLFRTLGRRIFLVPSSVAEREQIELLWTDPRARAPGTLRVFHAFFPVSIAMVALCFSERFFPTLSYSAVHALLFVQCGTGLLIAATAAMAIHALRELAAQAIRTAPPILLAIPVPAATKAAKDSR